MDATQTRDQQWMLVAGFSLGGIIWIGNGIRALVFPGGIDAALLPGWLFLLVGGAVVGAVAHTWLLLRRPASGMPGRLRPAVGNDAWSQVLSGVVLAGVALQGLWADPGSAGRFVLLLALLAGIVLGLGAAGTRRRPV